MNIQLPTRSTSNVTRITYSFSLIGKRLARSFCAGTFNAPATFEISHNMMSLG